MALGQAKTRKFNIGTAELRVGPLTKAMRLTQADSVGLVDKVSINVTQTKADLEGMFPKQIVDSAIIDQKAEITGTLREYSRANLNILLGNDIESVVPTDVATTTTASAAVAATTLTVTSAAGIAANDILMVWNPGEPENVNILKVDSVAGLDITLDTDTPVVAAIASGANVVAARPVSIGSVSRTNYFSCMIVQKQNSSGRPFVFNFWKVSNAAGMDYATDASAFASTDMKLTCLTPVALDYAMGQPLAHLAGIIPDHPMGMMVSGAD